LPAGQQVASGCRSSRGYLADGPESAFQNYIGHNYGRRCGSGPAQARWPKLRRAEAVRGRMPRCGYQPMKLPKQDGRGSWSSPPENPGGGQTIIGRLLTPMLAPGAYSGWGDPGAKANASSTSISTGSTERGVPVAEFGRTAARCSKCLRRLPPHCWWASQLATTGVRQRSTCARLAEAVTGVCRQWTRDSARVLCAPDRVLVRAQPVHMAPWTSHDGRR
jgi:hypothetical protein